VYQAQLLTSTQISHSDVPMYILGYRDSRIYLADRDINVTSFALSSSLLEYETCVLRGDMSMAAEILVCIFDP
jgi:coatomer subunit beta'